MWNSTPNFTYASLPSHRDVIIGLIHSQELTLSINAITAATDVLIAAILCSMLHGSRTGFKRYLGFVTALTHLVDDDPDFTAQTQ